MCKNKLVSRMEITTSSVAAEQRTAAAKQPKGGKCIKCAAETSCRWYHKCSICSKCYDREVRRKRPPKQQRGSDEGAADERPAKAARGGGGRGGAQHQPCVYVHDAVLFALLTGGGGSVVATTG